MSSNTTEYVQIKELKPGMKNINAVFIVLEVGPPTLTKEAREVRTLRVADASACVNLSVWDAAGALLQPGDIVRLTRGYAALWRAQLTLYSGKTGDLQKVGEFCMLFNEQVNMSEPQAPAAPPAPSERSNGAGPRPAVAAAADKQPAPHKTYVRGAARAHQRGASRR